ncbi:response regulator receiver domain protein (macronuclear) [Tetrahymena thermophila SB210]|uniref:Response regulator receiver domain protein n=1 Tax=Tetrahymena thermophila (strain SB210) TaxID=312017 RepID=I7M1P9_TETTS|nr:response regulator receiver domain protein [Tetrahymena thermophila SB210]EAR97315.2 response regulator receiver domain protein [Tetrahymena thermophila SB210]|eukprot:XP_001017560.2 response regulator receiver domain protein [Tetrahymena thermophila SB210]
MIIQQDHEKLLLNKWLLCFKSKNIEMSYQLQRKKYFPAKISYLIILQLLIQSLALIYAIIYHQGQARLNYLIFFFIAIDIINLKLMAKCFDKILIIVQLKSFLSLIFAVEVFYVQQELNIPSCYFLIYFLGYISICGKSHLWYNQILIIIVLLVYFYARTDQILQIGNILIYILFQVIKIYFEEKDQRLQYYDLFRENKINENFQNLIKNIIPCGLFVCSKPSQQKQIVKNIIDQEEVQTKDQVQSQFNDLQVKFVNRQCMQDLDIADGQHTITKIEQFKNINKYKTISNAPLVDKNQTNKTKIANLNSIDQKKDFTLNQVIYDYLNTNINDYIKSIEMKNKPEQTFLNVPYENGFYETKFFDIKLVNCQWDNTEACLCVLINLSQKVLNERQNQLEEYQKRMMSTITHNLKTPLNGIILLLQSLIQQKDQIPEELYYQIIDIYTNSELLLCMINDVIDYSKIQSDSFKLVTQKFNISKLLYEIKDMYATQLEKKQLQLILDYENLKDFTFNTDYERLKQILVNLTGNALKFTFEGYIKIVIKESNLDSNIVEIQVTDTGNGISKHIKQSLLQKKITDNHKHKLDKQSGSGIGLNICQQLVEKLGPHSKLFIQSVEKQGTKISFYLYKNFNRNRLASQQNHVQKSKQKRFSLKPQNFSMNTFKSDIYSYEDNQNSNNFIKINDKLQSNSNYEKKRGKKETLAILGINNPINNQQMSTTDNLISQFGFQIPSQDQIRQQKQSIIKQLIDEKQKKDFLRESFESYQLHENDEFNQINSKNINLLNQEDFIKHKLSVDIQNLRKASVGRQKSTSKLSEKKSISKTNSENRRSQRQTISKSFILESVGEIEEFTLELKHNFNVNKPRNKVNSIYNLFSNTNVLGKLDYQLQDKKQASYLCQDETSNNYLLIQNMEQIKSEQNTLINNHQSSLQSPLSQNFKFLSITEQPLLTNIESPSNQYFASNFAQQQQIKYQKSKFDQFNQKNSEDNVSSDIDDLKNSSSQKSKDQQFQITQYINENQSQYKDNQSNQKRQIENHQNVSKLIYQELPNSEETNKHQQNSQYVNNNKTQQSVNNNQTQHSRSSSSQMNLSQINVKEKDAKFNTQNDETNDQHNPKNYEKYIFKSHRNNLNFQSEKQFQFKKFILQNDQFKSNDSSNTYNNETYDAEQNFNYQDFDNQKNQNKQQNDVSGFKNLFQKQYSINLLQQVPSKSDCKLHRTMSEKQKYSEEHSNNQIIQKSLIQSYRELQKHDQIVLQINKPINSNFNEVNQKYQSLNIANITRDHEQYIKQALEGKKILIVDDTMFNVIALKALLMNITKNSIVIEEAFNGRQAMQKVLQSQELFDLIFMDVNMPVMDGLQATENIKQIDRNNKIIIVTAFSDETNRSECISIGADGFLTKPVKIKDLATQIQSVFKLYNKY